ncbi:SRPBCC family protein [Paenibacillus xylanilyticus]|uniref:SRPBCC family protein n=1 Tax=Paenibacillus xylanilyticus TaxID=248903 RepID=UPI0039A2D366
MSTTSTVTLTMKRQFVVSPEQVFDAWLDPHSMKKWLFTLETTNKVTQNDPRVGGTWEIVDHRQGKDYRAIGEYLKINRPGTLIFTFEMPQFSDTQDIITVSIMANEQGSEMTFTQEMVVPHEEGWTADDIEKAEREYITGSEQGWSLMFDGLKQLLETGKIDYPLQ